jgi:hypothetical protein
MGTALPSRDAGVPTSVAAVTRVRATAPKKENRPAAVESPLLARLNP